MFKNYVLIALRNLLKNKTTILINTFGLGIALACCITAYILVAFNIEFDDFHSYRKVEKIFRVHSHLTSNGNKQLSVAAPIPVGPMAREEIAGIQRFTRFAIGGVNVSHGIDAFSEQIAYADSTFFEMFDFPLVAGSYQSFKDPGSIFLSQEMAAKYFGDKDPVGQRLTLNFPREVEKQVVVGGVFQDIPINSSLVFNSIIRMEHFEEMRKLEQKPWEDWNTPGLLLELKDPAQAESIASMFGKYIPLRNKAKTDQTLNKITLEPFKTKIDTSNNLYLTYINTPIALEPLIIFVTLAVMILLIACFNMTNTSIAMTANRLKEIGVRKSIGAGKSQIIVQFLFETVLIILLSLVVGIAVANVIVPEFTSMWELPYGLQDINGINFIIALLIIVFMASILSGIYPALFGTRFNTIALLKGSIKIKGTNGLTRTLVTFQFALSVIVLIGGVIFIQNSKFQENIRFGYDKDQLLTINVQNEKEYRAMEAKAQANPQIKVVAVTDHQIGYSTYASPVTYQSMEYEVRHLGVGKKYFEAMGFTFLEGRPFDAEKTTDRNEAAVVSREFLKKVGIQGNPIGQQVEVHGNKRRIVGVIEDFVDNVFRSRDPEPFIFYGAEPETIKMMVVKAAPEHLASANEYMEKAWKERFPTKPYVSRYQESIVLENTKQTNANMKKIFLFLTILGGLLSITGIFSLASLNIARRTKEIGIRKALGASVSNVIMLLNREFFIILTLASLLGLAGGYYATSWLLDELYAFHVAVGLIPAIICAFFIFATGISTTSLAIYRAAKANPVDTLRDE